MRKQTKLVAVLSTAALLAIGASMTSFAATGWAEEDNAWVFYHKDGEKAISVWSMSGNNWYYLDENGEMAIDQIIEYKEDYYYVDSNGVMVTNQWVAIDNEDAGNDNEPDLHWYYFQANGKALKGPDSGKIALKTVNGKKYAFNDEAQMLYGWIKVDDQGIYADEDDAWQEADYYFGDPDDGSMTIGWRLIDITDENAGSSNQDWLAPAFTDDEDQGRWFYFKSNGKKVKAASADEIKELNINGRKYGFDQYGRMVAEWSYDQTERSASASQTPEGSLGTDNSARVDQTRNWKYFQSIEDGRKLAKDWFKVVAAEDLDGSKYDDDEAEWYYADGRGNLCANQLKQIKGKWYAFGKTGICLTGLQFIQTGADGINGSASDFGELMDDDDTNWNYDTESGFNDNTPELTAMGYSCYYFGDDGAMRTGKTTVDIDGDKFPFNFGKSGSRKGVGKTGRDDKKYYSAGKLMAAGKDEKYQVIRPVYAEDLTDVDATVAEGTLVGYVKYDDAEQFTNAVNAHPDVEVVRFTNLSSEFKAGTSTKVSVNGVDVDVQVRNLGVNTGRLRDGKIDELNIYFYTPDGGTTYELGLPTAQYGGYSVVNTSGTVSTSNSKNKDGNNVYYKLYNGKIIATFEED